MWKGNWHRRLAGAETDDVALLDFAAAFPAPGLGVVTLYLACGDIMRLGDTLTSIGVLHRVVVTQAITTCRRWKIRCAPVDQ